MKMRTALVTSGGDGPGINGVIAMLAKQRDIVLTGYHGGFGGIRKGKPVELRYDEIAHCVTDSKEIIRTGRGPDTHTQEGREQIIRKLRADGAEVLVVCGGNGSQQGAMRIHEEGFPTIFLPMSVDNDVPGTDYSIGHDTALNHIIRTLGCVHDTAWNMPGRIFMVEVLGGYSGELALAAGIAGGADLILIPECCTEKERVAARVTELQKQRRSVVIICTESAYEKKDYTPGSQGVSFEIGSYIEEKTGTRVRQTVLGYYMRAGAPSSRDMQLAAELGWKTAACIRNACDGVMIGISGGTVQVTGYDCISEESRRLKTELTEIARNCGQIME